MRRHDEASGLVAKAAALALFGHAYAHLPYESILKPQLVPLWGSNGKLMQMATKGAQSISCSDDKLTEAAQQARAFAAAAAAALVTATQTQERFFLAALSCPGATEHLTATA